MEEIRIGAFLCGFQKSGSSWLYKCFSEHPDIFVPDLDAIHLFSINYPNLDGDLNKFFSPNNGERVLLDPTPSYVRFPETADRIFQHNPKAKLMFTLRHPVERSYSHYWHHKRKRQVDFSFEDVLDYRGVGNVDLYDIWIRSSLYFEQLRPFFGVFPKDQIKVNLFDDLKADPAKYIKGIYSFLDVDPDFVPSVLQIKVNAAKGKEKKVPEDSDSKVKKLQKFGFKKVLQQAAIKGLDIEVGGEKFEDEYSTGISDEYKERLMVLFRPDIKNLEDLVGMDLSHWK